MNTVKSSHVPNTYAEKAKGVNGIDIAAKDSYGDVKSIDEIISVDYYCKVDIPTKKMI